MTTVVYVYDLCAGMVSCNFKVFQQVLFMSRLPSLVAFPSSLCLLSFYTNLTVPLHFLLNPLRFFQVSTIPILFATYLFSVLHFVLHFR